MKKAVVIGLGTLVAVFLIGIVGFWFWVQHYLGSAEFHRQVEAQLSRSLSAPCTVMPLRWTGLSVYTDGMVAKGSTASAFQELRADQVRAEINFRALLGRRLEITLIEAQQAEIIFDPAAPRVPWEAPVIAGGATSGVVAGLAPQETTVRQVVVRQMNMRWKRANATPVEVTGVQLLVEPDGATWKIEALQGKVKAGWGPDLELTEAKLRFRAPELFISKAELRPPGQGVVRISGEAAFEPASRLDLRVELEDMPVADYLPEDWRARLTGRLQGEIQVSGMPTRAETIKAQGKLELREGRLEALPVLEKIADVTRTREFRSLRLHRAVTDVQWTPAELRLDKIVVESEAVVRMEGGVTVTGNVLDGTLEVGTTPAVLRAIPGAQSHVFTQARGGYQWAQPGMRLTGTVDKPVEDLSPRLITAAIQGVQDEVINGLNNLWDKAKSVIPVAP